MESLQTKRLRADNIAIHDCTSGSIPLYLLDNNAKVPYGSLNVIIEYFPNHSDMFCLSHDCILESYLPKLLIEELIQSCKNFNEYRLNESKPTSKLMETLESTVRKLFAFVHQNALKPLLSQQLMETMGESLKTDSASFPDNVETYRAVACARLFFQYLLRDFKKVSFIYLLVCFCG